MRSSYNQRTHVKRAILYVLVILIGIGFVFPFIWMILSSFKLNKDVLAIPLRFFLPSGTGRATTTCSSPFPTSISRATF